MDSCKKGELLFHPSVAVNLTEIRMHALSLDECKFVLDNPVEMLRISPCNIK
jgi:hypothetical protein